MKIPEEQDPSWELLLKSKTQQANPSFVRNVVREVRKLEAETPENGLMLFFSWFKRPALVLPLALGATAILFAALTLLPGIKPSSSSNSVSGASIARANDPSPAASTKSFADLAESTDTESGITQDLEQIDYIGELVAISDPADLDDAAVADLFF